MTTNNKPSKAVPEVEAFEKIQRELEEFKADNTEFFEVLGELTARYNAALGMAEKAVRSQQVSCGPFQLTGKPSISYDAEVLYEEMGRDFFFAHGGSVKQVTEYAVDRAQAEVAYAKGLLPAEIVSKVRKVKLSYHKPPTVALP